MSTHLLPSSVTLICYLKIDGLAGVDDAVGNGGTVDNPAKHVDEDGLHLVVLGDDAEGLLHLENKN